MILWVYTTYMVTVIPQYKLKDVENLILQVPESYTTRTAEIFVPFLHNVADRGTLLLK
jgi:hypothetical protein